MDAIAREVWNKRAARTESIDGWVLNGWLLLREGEGEGEGFDVVGCAAVGRGGR